LTFTLKYEVNCSSAIVILFEPRPTISSSTLGTGICSQANLIIFICSANVEEDVPEYFNKLHNISGKVASKFYNDMETPVQIILGPIGSGKTFALQMKQSLLYIY
jgi:hypothetical protein